MRLLAFVVMVSGVSLAQTEAPDCGGKDFAKILVPEYEGALAMRFVELGPALTEADRLSAVSVLESIGASEIENSDELGVSGKLGDATVAIGPRFNQSKFEVTCSTHKDVGRHRRDALLTAKAPPPLSSGREQLKQCPEVLAKMFADFESKSESCPVRRNQIDRNWNFRNVVALRKMNRKFQICFHQRTRAALIEELDEIISRVQGPALTAKELALATKATPGEVRSFPNHLVADRAEADGSFSRFVLFNAKWSGPANPFGALLPEIPDKKPRVVVAVIYGESTSGGTDVGSMVFESAPLDAAAITDAFGRASVEAYYRLRESAHLCERANDSVICK